MASVGLSYFSLQGTLYNSQGAIAGSQPFHIYDENHQFLGASKTGKNGHFEATLSIPVQRDQEITLLFKACKETKHGLFKEKKEFAETKETFRITSLQKDLGDIHLDPPFKKEKTPFKYMVDILAAVVPAKVQSLIEGVEEKLDVFNTHDIANISDSFNFPKTALTAENTWKLCTNGICPMYFKKDGESITVELNFDRYSFDKLQSLPNVKLYFSAPVCASIAPELKKIEVEFRTTLDASSDPKNKTHLKTYTPEGHNFEEGLRIANSSLHIYGQTVFHLGLGHIYGARVALTANDYLKGHPLGNLILPHTPHIRTITEDLGKVSIMGDTGVLNASGLSTVGIQELLQDTIAAVDPFTYAPRAPIGDHHVFAEAQQLHFKIVKEAVHEYFDSHWKEMSENWTPIHVFFRRVFKDSPQYRPFSGETETTHWVDSSEMGKEGSKIPPREKYRTEDAEVRSLRWVAKDPQGPQKTDRALIENFCADFIHRVTLYHFWLHRSQFTETVGSPPVLDVNFAPITLNSFGKLPFGGIKEDEALLQSEIGQTFRNFDASPYGLLKSEDVYEGIKKRMIEAREQYLALGIDPNDIPFGTVI